MSGGLMSGGLKSGGLMSGGLKSYDPRKQYDRLSREPVISLCKVLVR